MLKINKEFTLPKDFKGEINLNVLAQALYVYEDRAHVGLRNTKTRSEVNRTTKKVYKQKGTGGARHGSRRANLFVGGGIIFGPRPLKRVVELSKNLKRVAKAMALSAKAKEKEIAVVSGISTLTKTKDAGTLLKELKVKRSTFVLADKNFAKLMFLRNLKNANSILFKNSNAFDIVKGGMILMDEDIFAKEPVKKVKKTVEK